MASEKFKGLVHYVVHECSGHPDRLGAIRLNKSLWFADVFAYKTQGVPISNERYVKRQMGPVPAHILEAIRELQADGKIVVREPAHQYDTRKYISVAQPDDAILSDDERSIATSAMEAVCGFSANAISELTHDMIWDAAEMGEDIPLHATLASAAGEITGEVLSWANGFIEEAA